MTEPKKMGRPTDEIKPHKISARLSDRALKILDDYCASKRIGRPQGIRDAIDHLKIEK